MREMYLACWTIVCAWQCRPWTGPNKPSLQHFQFCRFGHFLEISNFTILFWLQSDGYCSVLSWIIKKGKTLHLNLWQACMKYVTPRNKTHNFNISIDCVTFFKHLIRNVSKFQIWEAHKHKLIANALYKFSGFWNKYNIIKSLWWIKICLFLCI
jgi:hypothetical protein